MLDALDTHTIDTPVAADTAHDTVANTVQELHDLFQRLQGELKFQKTRNEALNFDLARLKRWRFGSSSESLETST